MQPMNYLLANGNPLDTILGYVKDYQNIRNNANVLASQAEANRIKQAQNDREIEAINASRSLDWKDHNALREFAGRYGDMDLTKGAREHLNNLDAKEKQALLGDMSMTVSLLQNGRSDLAVADLRAKANAYRNSGNEAKALEYEGFVSQMENDPVSAYNGLSLVLASVAGKDNISGYETLIKTNRPDVRQVDLGHKVQTYNVNPITGEQTLGDMSFDKGVSPDTALQEDNKYAIAEMDNETRKDVARINTQGSIDVANINGQYGVQREQMSQQGQNMRTQAELAQQAELEKQKWLQEQIKNRQGKYEELGGKVYFTWFDEQGIKIAVPATDVNGNAMGGVKPLTDTQSNAFTFGSRMLNSGDILDKLEQNGVRLNFGQLMTDDDSFTLTKAIVNKLSTPQERQYAQAVRDFVNATLRKESGAAIGMNEFRNAQKQYFPMPGDDPKTIAQKALNRRITMKTILTGVPNDFLLSQGIDLGKIHTGQQIQATQQQQTQSTQGSYASNKYK